MGNWKWALAKKVKIIRGKVLQEGLPPVDNGQWPMGDGLMGNGKWEMDNKVKIGRGKALQGGLPPVDNGQKGKDGFDQRGILKVHSWWTPTFQEQLIINNIMNTSIIFINT